MKPESPGFSPGECQFYVKLNNNNTYYAFSALDNEETVLVDIGSHIKFSIKNEENTNKIIEGFLESFTAPPKVQIPQNNEEETG